MTKLKWICVIALLGPLTVAQAIPQMEPGEQVRQLSQVVNLEKQQEQKIEKLLTESKSRTDKLYGEIQALKISLGQEVGPDFSESSIRKKSEELGELSGELTAETALLQAKIQDILTEQQRQILLQRAQQAQQRQLNP